VFHVLKQFEKKFMQEENSRTTLHAFEKIFDLTEGLLLLFMEMKKDDRLIRVRQVPLTYL
jgi:hypothetical protein